MSINYVDRSQCANHYTTPPPILAFLWSWPTFSHWFKSIFWHQFFAKKIDLNHIYLSCSDYFVYSCRSVQNRQKYKTDISIWAPETQYNSKFNMNWLMSRASSGSTICTGRQVWMIYQCLHNLHLALQFAAGVSCGWDFIKMYPYMSTHSPKRGTIQFAYYQWHSQTSVLGGAQLPPLAAPLHITEN